MKFYSTKRLVQGLAAAALLFLAACSQDTPSNPSPAQATASAQAQVPTLAEPLVRTTHAPDPQTTALAYFAAWQEGDHQAMYAMLSESSRQALSLEEFLAQYQRVESEAAVSEVTAEMLTAAVQDPNNALVSYRVNLLSGLIGMLSADTSMALTREGGQWRIIWNDGMILPQLAGGNYLSMDLVTPERGIIFDRNGIELASLKEATAIGFYPDSLNPENPEDTLVLLSRLSGLAVATIEGFYVGQPPGTVGYVPLAEVPNSTLAGRFGDLSGVSGLVMQPYTSRFYPNDGAAPHAVGYVSAIQGGDELEQYRRMGYRGTESIGRDGIEGWGERILAGKHGGTLWVTNPQGQFISELGTVVPEASQNITTTLELDFQTGVQAALRGFRGAAVVLERDTGRVLALASSPGFDQNAYQTANFNWQSLLGGIASDPDQPLYNRATQGQYPLGSVFKIITLAAGLENGAYPENFVYNCDYSFTELFGVTLYDWTWERFQDNGVTPPSGPLTPVQALMRSCNPFFYKTGVTLFDQGKPAAMTDMAKAFGLGAVTGIVVLEEKPGVVPIPASQLDATNLAVGQGDLQVTPLQVARFVAAIGNGGTLYRPQLIEKIAGSSGVATQVFEPEAQGTLPITPETLATIREGMLGVTSSKKPEGTAQRVFSSMTTPVYGKTGTAQTGPGLDPHAWFAAYTAAENPDRPDIAIAVIAENAGEGSAIAAPITRRIIELYFTGRPGRLYPWEAAYGVTKTPTPLWTETPTPDPEAEEGG